MAQFYGEISSRSPRGGKSNKVTRMGDKSGMTAHIRGWDVGVRVVLRVDAGGKDIVCVYKTKGSNAPNDDELIATIDEKSCVVRVPDDR